MPVWKLNLKLTPNTIPAAPAGLTQRIRDRFAAAAGPMIVNAVQSVLGTSSIYTLSPGYAARKARLPGFRRYPGKSQTQPIILTGSLFEGLRFTMSGDTLTVDVDPSHGMDGGFDYGEFWEEKVSYLEQGLALVENDLDELLLDCIFAEMNL